MKHIGIDQGQALRAGTLTALFLLLSPAATAPLQARGLEPAQGGAPTSNPSMLAGAPLDVAPETWVWVDFPDSRCAYGSQTGIGVNLTDRSNELVVFFEGGGACWDYESCYVNVSASYLSGYDGRSFASSRPYERIPLFDRNDYRNPLPDASYVYIPYCTGDVHSGDNVLDLGPAGRQKTTYFVGQANVQAYLSRLVPTLPDTGRVWVSGWSAGGYGAGLNWVPFADAFPNARVDVIDDSGPPFMPAGNRWSEWVSAWNWSPPEGCVDCLSDLANLVDYYVYRFDGRANFALLSYTKDMVISSYYGMTRRQFERNLYELADTQFEGLETMHYFFVEGSSHVMLDWDTVGPGGVKLVDWLTWMVQDDPRWQNVRP